VGPLEGTTPPQLAPGGDARLHSGLLRLATSNATRWEHLPSPPPALARLPWPRAAPTLAQMPALALAGAAAAFDFAGVVVGAGPRYQAPDFTTFQWVFMADHTCGGAADGQAVVEGQGGGGAVPWLLAVKLQGPLEAVDWVDDAADAGAVFFLSDLDATGSDDARCLWQAAGGQHSGCGRARGRAAAAAAAAAWAAERKGVLAQMRCRVEALIA
jgi:hypothetical protein